MLDSEEAQIAAKGAEDPARRALGSARWIERASAPPPSESLLARDPGCGESSVIAWAVVMGNAAVVLDDHAARRCARSFLLAVRGTLGLVLRGCRRGVIQAPRAVLESMRRQGMWLADAVLERALREAGVQR